MIVDFPLLQQPPGSNSCLPSVVRAVLLWYGRQITSEEVAELCLERSGGCVLDRALENLGQAGFDVEELQASEDMSAAETLLAVVMDEDDPQPVIVTLINALVTVEMDHAVVITSIIRQQGSERYTTMYMDPLSGRIETETTGMFWIWWEYAGQRAFTIRP